MSHSRKLKLTPLQNDLLWTLEEAGAENLTCVLSTLWGKHKSREPKQFLEQVEAEMLALIQLELVAFYKTQAKIPYVGLSKKEMRIAQPLRRLVKFDPLANLWMRVDGSDAELLKGLMLTEKGRKEMQR